MSDKRPAPYHEPTPAEKVEQAARLAAAQKERQRQAEALDRAFRRGQP